MTGWQLEGTAPEAYEKYLVPALFAPFAERLIEIAEPRRGDRVLDVGCGTGIVARVAAGRGCRAVGADFNPLMLETARAAEPAIEWLAADAGALPLPDASFELVACQASLQYFPDRAAALREMRRVLAPGGRLALSVWRSREHQPAWLRLAEALDRHVDPEVGDVMRAPFAFGDPEALRTLVATAGFRDVALRIVIESVRFPSATEMLRRQAVASPLAEPLAALGDEARAALARDFTASMRPYEDDDGVCFAQETHVVTATRAE
jgi:ubiquinone/menaquinone biosynthesis C-methylase UbiE